MVLLFLDATVYHNNPEQRMKMFVHDENGTTGTRQQAGSEAAKKDERQGGEDILVGNCVDSNKPSRGRTGISAGNRCKRRKTTTAVKSQTDMHTQTSTNKLTQKQTQWDTQTHTRTIAADMVGVAGLVACPAYHRHWAVP